MLGALEIAEVPSGPIYSVADMAADEHYQARGMFEMVDVPPECNGGKPLAVPAIPPRLERTPGATTWAGPEVGAHNEEVWCGLLGLCKEELDALQAEKII